MDLGKRQLRPARAAEGSWWHRHAIAPVLELLRCGTTPEMLAWSLALGLVVGVNPLLGSTTLAALALASIFRLNLVASQITNHLVYPLQLALFPVFIRLGVKVFRTAPLPLHTKAIFHAARTHPWDTTRMLWLWEWHALVVWAVCASMLMPVLAILLRFPLRRALAGLHLQPESAAA